MKKAIRNSRKQRRKYWLAAFVLALYALTGWLRFQQALTHWYYLLELGLRPHPLYIAVSGGLIGIGYSTALIFHFLRWRWAPKIVRIAGILLIGWVWIDRIWIGTRETFINLLPITILISACTILLDILLTSKLAYKQKHEEQNGAQS